MAILLHYNRATAHTFAVSLFNKTLRNLRYKDSSTFKLNVKFFERKTCTSMYNRYLVYTYYTVNEKIVFDRQCYLIKHLNSKLFLEILRQTCANVNFQIFFFI